MRRIIISLFFILTIFIISAFAEGNPNNIHKLIIFYSPTCHKCIEVKKELIPKIEKDFKDKIWVEYRDITDIENYKLLVSLKEKHKVKIKSGLPIFYFAGHFLKIESEAQIKNVLKGLIAKAPRPMPQGKPDLSNINLITHFKTFGPFAIISAGLIDGINPCAFTVIVFFISFLALQGYKKKELIAIGLSFIFAVFLTYFFIGLGLFGFLYRLKEFWILVRVFNFSIGIFSIILGILCLYDFFKFQKTGMTEGLILQLPAKVKVQIHSVIGLHYRKPKEQKAKAQNIFMARLILSAFITGFLVSILEAVCTGQVYLPTIAFILKTAPFKLEALSYLLLYNLMFILPLFIIFIFALLGVTSAQFSAVLKKHLLTVKILMALVFFGLGIFLIWRG